MVVGVLVADRDGVKETGKSATLFCGLLHPTIRLDSNKTKGSNSSLLIMFCGFDVLSYGCLYTGTGYRTFPKYFWRINTTVHNCRW